MTTDTTRLRVTVDQDGAPMAALQVGRTLYRLPALDVFLDDGCATMVFEDGAELEDELFPQRAMIVESTEDLPALFKKALRSGDDARLVLKEAKAVPEFFRFLLGELVKLWESLEELQEQYADAVVAEDSAPPRPLWGGQDPTDVDELAADDEADAAREPVDHFTETDAGPLRFFTITTADGREILNVSTTKGDTLEEAETHVRKSWAMLAQGQSGKEIVRVVHQEHGRVGEDQPETPTVAPPPDEGAASLFRWVAQTHEASMSTQRECRNLAQLLEILQSLRGFEGVTEEMVDIRKHEYEEPTGWDLHLVTVKGHVVGLLNGEL